MSCCAMCSLYDAGATAASYVSEAATEAATEVVTSIKNLDRNKELDLRVNALSYLINLVAVPIISAFGSIGLFIFEEHPYNPLDWRLPRAINCIQIGLTCWEVYSTIIGIRVINLYHSILNESKERTLLGLNEYKAKYSEHCQKQNELKKINTTPLEEVYNQQNLALTLEATSDHNGACVSFRDIPNFSKAYKPVSSIKDINDAIDQAISQKNEIRVILLYAHGSTDSIILGGGLLDLKIDSSNVAELGKSFNKLNPDTVIVLNSCYAAVNIAKLIAKNAGGRKIICTDIPTGGIRINTKSINPPILDVEFREKEIFDKKHTIIYNEANTEEATSSSISSPSLDWSAGYNFDFF